MHKKFHPCLFPTHSHCPTVDIHTPQLQIPKFDQVRLPKTQTKYQAQQQSFFHPYHIQGPRGALQPHSSLGELQPLTCHTDFQVPTISFLQLMILIQVFSHFFALLLTSNTSLYPSILAVSQTFHLFVPPLREFPP